MERLKRRQSLYNLLSGILARQFGRYQSQIPKLLKRAQIVKGDSRRISPACHNRKEIELPDLSNRASVYFVANA